MSFYYFLSEQGMNRALILQLVNIHTVIEREFDRLLSIQTDPFVSVGPTKGSWCSWSVERIGCYYGAVCTCFAEHTT